MNSIYPDAIDGYAQLPLIIDGVTNIDASNINAIRSAIIKIESELGTNPRKNYENVKQRLEDIESSIVDLETLISSIESSISSIQSDITDLENQEVEVTIVNPVNTGLLKTVSGTDITGTSILIDSNDDVTFPSDINVTSNINSNGNINLGGNINLSGDIASNGNLVLTGTITSTNNVNLTLSNSEALTITGGTTKLQGQRNYGSRSSSPSAPLPTPADGDLYFDTTLVAQMYYDSLRSKWLSVETFEFPFGRNGTVPVGGYFRTIDGKAMSSTIGEYFLKNACIIGIRLTRDTPPSSPWVVRYAVEVGGSISAIYELSGLATNGSSAFDSDVSAGDVASVLVASSSSNEAYTGTYGKIYYKWRG